MLESKSSVLPLDDAPVVNDEVVILDGTKRYPKQRLKVKTVGPLKMDFFIWLEEGIGGTADPLKTGTDLAHLDRQSKLQSSILFG